MEYDYLNNVYIGSDYGDMRRERAALMKQAIFNNDAAVKPRIRQITLAMQQYLASRSSSLTGKCTEKSIAKC
jgi:hypothetical protein